MKVMLYKVSISRYKCNPSPTHMVSGDIKSFSTSCGSSATDCVNVTDIFMTAKCQCSFQRLSLDREMGPYICYTWIYCLLIVWLTTFGGYLTAIYAGLQRLTVLRTKFLLYDILRPKLPSYSVFGDFTI